MLELLICFYYPKKIVYRSLDERTRDGHYYASASKMMIDYLKHPDKPDEPTDVIPDIY